MAGGRLSGRTATWLPKFHGCIGNTKISYPWYSAARASCAREVHYQETSNSTSYLRLIPAHPIPEFFALKTNQKLAMFVWIFTCVDFHGKIKTKVCRNRDIVRLPLKPPGSFNSRNTMKTVAFAFLWIWSEPVRGRQREENFQETSWKANKNFSTTRPPSFSFSLETCFQYSFTVFVVFTSCMLHLEVSRLKTANPHPD